MLGAAAAPADGPAYTPDGKMIFPADYRDWIYLSSGMDMAYTEGAEATRHVFDNVFVDRKAATAFTQTGHWPDKTVFVLEIRSGEGAASINKRGLTQTERRGVEVFFGFGGADPAPASQIPKTADCYACHQQHGAVDTTFTQFYPTMLPIAKAKGTVRGD